MQDMIPTNVKIANVNKIPQRQVLKYTKNDLPKDPQRFEDYVSQEQALLIKVKTSKSNALSKNLAVTMRSPADDIELTVGFLFTEGLISSIEEILDIVQVDENTVQVTIPAFKDEQLQNITRNFFTSSSCGICSKPDLSFFDLETSYMPWTSKFTMKEKDIYRAKDCIGNGQGVFEKTGSVHAVALCDNEGVLQKSFEDVGRHNAMDKIIGYGLLNKMLAYKNYALIVSGRLSFELVQKASMAGVPMIIALGAPSDLAIDEAYAQNICLVGFAKNHSFNVYSAFERII